MNYNREDLQKKLEEQEAFLEQYWPANVAELSALTGIPEALVERKIAYMVQTQKKNKHFVLADVLTFHRIKF